MPHPTPRSRRAVAAAASGLLVAGLAAVVVGSPPAAAAPGDLTGSSTYFCGVTIGRPQESRTELAEVPVEASLTIADPGVASISTYILPSEPAGLDLTLPSSLLEEVRSTGATAASTVVEPTSAPVIFPTPALEEDEVETALPLQGATVARRTLPQASAPWTIRAQPTTGYLQVPGWAGPGTPYDAADPATYDLGTIAMPGTITAHTTLFLRAGGSTPLELDCRVGSNAVVTQQVPVTGTYRADGFDQTIDLPYGQSRQVRLRQFLPGGGSAQFDYVERPEHGTLTSLGGDLYEYTPDPGFTGTDPFYYEFYDPQTGYGSGNVSITVQKAAALITQGGPPAVSWGKQVPIRVDVDVADAGGVDGGVLELYSRGELLTSATTGREGRATVVVPRRSLPVGDHELVVLYSGTDSVAPSRFTRELEVTRAETTLAGTVQNPVVRAGRTLTRIGLRTGPIGVRATGLVTAFVGGRGVASGRVEDGRGTMVLPTFAKPGTYAVKVRYLGSRDAAPVTTAVPVTVVE